MTDSCWAIVPLKCFALSKTRLAPLLSAGERQQLARDMFANVLRSLCASSRIDRVLVLSPERLELPDAVERMVDNGRDLNWELNDALSCARSRGVTSLLVLHADLPLLQATEVDTLVECGRQAGLALAPDRCGRGTNALLLASDLPWTCQFGADSLARHRQQALSLGLEPAFVRLPGLAFDVDTPADWQDLQIQSQKAINAHAV